MVMANAQEQESVIAKIGDLGKGRAVSAKSGSTRSTVSNGSYVRMVIASDSTIQPGKFEDYGEVPADFGGAENLAVSISATSGSLTGTIIMIGWAAPNEYFVATDLIKGTSLVDKTMGGARVPVHGPALKILVGNDGTAPVTIRQLAIYAFLH